MCRIFKIARSGYYHWLKPKASRHKQQRQSVLRQLIYFHEKYPVLGLDPLHYKISQRIPCSRGLVYSLMKEHRIYSKRKKAFKCCTTDSRHNLPIAPNLLKRNFHFSAPNQAWVGDISYISTEEGWLYLAIVKDLCTRQVVGYACSKRIDTQLVMDALKMAVHREKPQKGIIFHSDRGSQYCSLDFRKLLNRFQIQQSMSRKGDPYDNAVAENFFSCLKCELVHLLHFKTRDQAYLHIFRYIESFYNLERPHSALNYLSPKMFKDQFLSKTA